MNNESNSAPALPKRSVSSQILGPIVLFVFIGIGIWFVMTVTSWISGDGDSKQATEQPAAPTDSELFVEAKAIVTQALKAPSTAKFPSSSSATITRYSDGYKVASYVDSQNGFGAMIRSEWSVVFTYVGDMVDVHQVVVDGEEVYRKAGE